MSFYDGNRFLLNIIPPFNTAQPGGIEDPLAQLQSNVTAIGTMVDPTTGTVRANNIIPLTGDLITMSPNVDVIGTLKVNGQDVSLGPNGQSLSSGQLNISSGAAGLFLQSTPVNNQIMGFTINGSNIFVMDTSGNAVFTPAVQPGFFKISSAVLIAEDIQANTLSNNLINTNQIITNLLAVNQQTVTSLNAQNIATVTIGANSGNIIDFTTTNLSASNGIITSNFTIGETLYVNHISTGSIGAGIAINDMTYTSSIINSSIVTTFIDLQVPPPNIVPQYEFLVATALNGVSSMLNANGSNGVFQASLNGGYFLQPFTTIQSDYQERWQSGGAQNPGDYTNTIQSSPDRLTWIGTPQPTFGWYCQRLQFSTNIGVAVGQEPAQINPSFYTTDGSNWNQINSIPFQGAGQAIGTDGIRWAIGGDQQFSGLPSLYYTSDFTNWTNVLTDMTYTGSIAQGNSIWVRTGSKTGVPQVQYSYDLDNWTDMPTNLFDVNPGNVVFENNKFIAQGNSNNTTALWTSDDGINWTAFATPFAFVEIRSVRWTGSQYALGLVAVEGLLYSDDLLTFTPSPIGLNTVNDIASRFISPIAVNIDPFPYLTSTIVNTVNGLGSVGYISTPSLVSTTEVVQAGLSSLSTQIATGSLATIFDGGAPDSIYIQGPVFDCGTIT